MTSHAVRRQPALGNTHTHETAVTRVSPRSVVVTRLTSGVTPPGDRRAIAVKGQRIK